MLTQDLFSQLFKLSWIYIAQEMETLEKKNYHILISPLSGMDIEPDVKKKKEKKKPILQGMVDS